MANKRIYELDEQTTFLSTLKLVVDSADFVEPKYVTVAVLLGDIITNYGTADTAIKSGTGLQANGTLLADADSNFIKASDFTAAGYDLNLRNMSRLLDRALTSLQATLYYRETIDVTSAELKDILATPKTLITSIDDNYVNLIDIAGYIDWNTAAYSESNDLIIQYATTNNEIATITGSLMTATSDSFCKGTMTANVKLSKGESVELTAAANYTGGDSPIKIYATYELVQGGDLSIVVKPNCCVLGSSASFTNASLVDDKLVVNHALGTTDLIAVVYNGDGAVEVITQTLGDASGLDQSNNITFDFGGEISGTYTYVIFNKNA